MPESWVELPEPQTPKVPDPWAALLPASRPSNVPPSGGERMVLNPQTNAWEMPTPDDPWAQLEPERAPTRVFIDPDSIRKAKTLSATLDIPFSVAHQGVKALSDEFDKQSPGWLKEAEARWKTGWADVYTSIGRAAQWLGAPQLGEDYVYYGNKVRDAYMPSVRREEFQWSNLKDPRWLAMTAIQNTPAFLSLIPAAVAGAYATSAGAAAMGFGLAGRYILGALGGAALSRPIESAFEAGQAYDEAVNQGASKDEAEARASFAFSRNMVLTGLDAAQLALAFTPLRALGPTVDKMLRYRVASVATRLAGVGLMEAGEEAYQAGIQQMARGERMTWNPEMQESAAIGFIFGAGTGTAGSVFEALTSRIESNMPDGMREEYQADKVAGQAMGKSETEATRDALDNVASHPEGQAVIEKTMKELNDIGEGKPRPTPTVSEQEAEISKAEEAEGPELISDEQLDAIASGEQSIEDIFQLEEMAARTPEEMAREEETVRVLREGAAEQVPVGVPEGPPLPDVVTRKGEELAPKQFISEETYQAALAEFKEKTSGLHAGIDPTAIKPLATIAAYHIERGIRKFADVSKILIEKFGEEIRPHLRKIWREAKKLVQTPATENQSLSLFVKNSGGIDLNKVDPGVRGEYEALLQEGGRKAREFIKRGKGLSPDEMSQIAAESEFIEEPDTALLAEALKSDLRGDKVYSARSELFERKTELQAERDVEAEAELRGRELAEQQEREAEAVDMEGFEEFEAAVESAARGQRMEKEVGRRVAAVPEAKLTVPPGKMKQAIRLTTGQQRVANMIREDVALRAAFKKAEENARIAYKAGSKDALEKAKADFRDLLIKAQAKAEMFGFKEGFRVSTRLTNKHLTQQFKAEQADIKATQKMIIGYIEDNLPPNMRGKYLNAIVQNLTKLKQERVMESIDQLREKLNRKNLIAKIDALKVYHGNISLDYQRRLDDLLGDIDTKNITQKTLEKLAGLQAYAEREGMPSGVSPRMRQQLERLSQIPAASLTTEQLKELVEIGNHLKALGKLKQQLKYKYQQREREKAQAKLVADTHNLDPKVSGNETMWDAIKKATIFAHFQTLSTLRVGEALDGYREGRENVKYVKEGIERETEANFETRIETQRLLEEVQATGVPYSEELERRLTINALALEGADTQVQTLLEHYGYEGIPPLTEQEAKLIPIAEKFSNVDRDLIAAYHEERTNTPFVKLPRYIKPLKYEGEFIVDNTDAILEHGHRMTRTAQGFVMERQPGVGKLPRVDFLGMVEQGIRERKYYLKMQPWLDNLAYLVKSEEYHKVAGDVGTRWWIDYLDIVSRRGWSVNAHSNDVTNVLRRFRYNMGEAILGYKLTSFLVQPLALFQAMAEMQARYGGRATLRMIDKVTKSLIVPGYAKEYVETSTAMKERQYAGGEVTIEEALKKYGGFNTKGFRAWYMRNGLTLLLAADVRTAAGVQMQFEEELTKIKFPNAKREAEFMMRLVSSSAEVTFRPQVLSRGEAMRAVFTFGSFMLNAWGQVTHDMIIKRLIKTPGWKSKYVAIIGLGIVIASQMAEGEGRKFLRELIVGKLPDLPPWYIRAIYAIPSMIPFFGQIIDPYKSVRGTAEVPIQRVMTDLFAAPWNPTKAKAWAKSAEAVLTLTTGIPGIAQGFDIIEGTFLPDERQKQRLVK